MILPESSLQLVRRYRIPALICAFAVLACELISHPFTTMGVVDDGPYILIAQHLASTGHIVYNGPTTPILGWQLYLGAAFIKLFGFSFTTVRMSTLLIAMITAFVLQRILVRSNITERNATIGTLALVLSPLYLMLSVTFMTDIQGMCAVVLCLYGCLRALQASSSRTTIGWLCFAVTTNAVCGTSRQIAWLGLLVMVPSTLWLLRRNRTVLVAGFATVVLGVTFILSCVHWFLQQPYNVHESLFVHSYPKATIAGDYLRAFLDAIFLLLPITALFIPSIRRSTKRSVAISCIFLLCCILMVAHGGQIRMDSLLEPTLWDQWVNAKGIFNSNGLHGVAPAFLSMGERWLLTIASLAAIVGIMTAWVLSHRVETVQAASNEVLSKHLSILLVPYAAAYLLLLIPRAASTGIFDRYLLGILFIPLLWLLRVYQERISARIPTTAIALIGVMAIFSVSMTHNNFVFYRARAALAAELNAQGIPDTAIDNGWEYNMEVELQHASYLNDPRMVMPANAYIHVPEDNNCATFWRDRTPHIDPLYSVSFDPNACYGPAPFAPINYSRWLAAKKGTLYVVRYKPSNQ